MNDVRDIKWSTQRPTVPGAYWVRGFCLDSGKERQAALVEVCESEHGLICNLHEPNSERPGKFHSWHEVSECHESFEWSQPLLPASPCPHIATSREGTSYCRLAESSVPEGCTSYDAQMLRRANHVLIDENAKLREALQFYAGGQHFIRDASSWDTVSGEPENFWCDESGTATVEDGYVAKMTLAQADALNQPEKSP